MCGAHNLSCDAVAGAFIHYHKRSLAMPNVTYPDLHLVLCFLALHSQIFLLYFLHQFLVDCQTKCDVKYRVLVRLKLPWHLVLKVLEIESIERMKFGADQTLVTPSISFWRRSDLATERRVRASLKRTSRPSQRKLSRILQANYEKEDRQTAHFSPAGEGHGHRRSE